MTVEEAIALVRERWAGGDGCRSCGRHPALYEFEPLEGYVDEDDIALGYVSFPCSGDDGSEIHRGMRISLHVPAQQVKP